MGKMNIFFFISLKSFLFDENLLKCTITTEYKIENIRTKKKTTKKMFEQTENDSSMTMDSTSGRTGQMVN